MLIVLWLLVFKVAHAETRSLELRNAHDVEVKQLTEELENVKRRQSDDIHLAVEQLETVRSACNSSVAVNNNMMCLATAICYYRGRDKENGS